MTWLSQIEQYSKQYYHLLQKNNLDVVSTVNGPGMGACIYYQNESIELRLTNDRSQYFLGIQECDGIEYIDLSVLLAICEAQLDGLDLRKINKVEKERFWAINYSYKDPFQSFFSKYNEICILINQSKINETRELVKAYYKDRGKWLFS